MLIENIELTMSHLGLGNLNEYALMVLFGNAHSHHLTLDTGINPGEIQDDKGEILYPAYFFTSLKVPTTALLHTYQLWQRVSIGVDVRRFGDTLLESNYIFSQQGEIGDRITDWNADTSPTMYGNNLIVVDVVDEPTTKRKVSNPHPQYIAELPKVAKAPVGIMNSKRIRSHGFDEELNNIHFNTRKPINYRILPGRDTANGHAMIFAKFCQVMDYAEQQFLSGELLQAIPQNVLSNMCVLEREIYYYGNCYTGEVLSIHLKGNFEKCEDEDEYEEMDYIPAAYLNINFEITQQRDNVLLAMGKVKKIIAVPMKDQELVLDVYRILQQFKL